MKLTLAIIAILFSTAAFAQAPQQQPSASEQALAGKLMEEINSNITYRAQVVQLQNQIKELQAKVPPPEQKETPKK